MLPANFQSTADKGAISIEVVPIRTDNELLGPVFKVMLSPLETLKKYTRGLYSLES